MNVLGKIVVVERPALFSGCICCRNADSIVKFESSGVTDCLNIVSSSTSLASFLFYNMYVLITTVTTTTSVFVCTSETSYFSCCLSRYIQYSSDVNKSTLLLSTFLCKCES